MSHFTGNHYLVRRKILKIFGGSFHIYDPDGQVVGFCAMKAFKLKEDLRLFTDETKSTEILRINARSILDFGATYDVYDSATDTPLGALRRRGVASIFRDQWLILGEGDAEIGDIKEDSAFLALIRRFLSNLIPQTYHCTLGPTGSAVFKQNFNPFVMKIKLDLTQWPAEVSRDLAIAAAILLCAIEGKQN